MLLQGYYDQAHDVMDTGCAAGEGQWRARLTTLGQVVRQVLVSRQLLTHLPTVSSQPVLDSGCGQGTQVLALARRGHVVTGLDSSATLLGALQHTLSTEVSEVRDRVQLILADAERLPDLFAPASFNAVLCHG